MGRTPMQKCDGMTSKDGRFVPCTKRAEWVVYNEETGDGRKYACNEHVVSLLDPNRFNIIYPIDVYIMMISNMMSIVEGTQED